MWSGQSWSEVSWSAAVAATAGQIIAVGQVIEIDVSQAIGRLKTVALAQALESGLAQAVARLKTLAVTQVLETDLAQAVAWAPKKRLVATVVETDFAQVISAVLSGAAYRIRGLMRRR